MKLESFMFVVYKVDKIVIESNKELHVFHKRCNFCTKNRKNVGACQSIASKKTNPWIHLFVKKKCSFQFSDENRW